MLLLCWQSGGYVTALTKKNSAQRPCKGAKDYREKVPSNIEMKKGARLSLSRIYL